MNAGLTIDLAELDSVEQALTEYTIQHSAVIEASIDGISIIDLENDQLIYSNRSHTKMFGYAINELRGKSWKCLHPVDQIEYFETIVKPILATSGQWQGESIGIRQDGSAFNKELSLSLLSNNQVVCICRNITYQKAVLRENKRKEDALKTIVEGTAGKTGAEFYRTCTQYLAEIFEVRYTFLTKLLDQSFHKSEMISLWTGGELIEPYEMELAGTPCLATYQNSWGIFPSNLQASFPTATALASLQGESYISVVIRDFEGKIIGNLGVIDTKPLPTDTATLQFILQLFATRIAAEMKRQNDEDKIYETNRHLELSNQELLHATHRKNEFLATMSHELRTPLNAILGMSEALQDKVYGELNERQVKSLCTIRRSGQHLLSVINDILDVSKIEAGKLELDINTTVVQELCNSSLIFVKQQAFDKQIKLTMQLPPAIGNIAVDERRMRQVLINLLSNAVKFTPIGGKIMLTVIRQEIEDSEDGSSWIEFKVTDTGIGISLADRDKLFQPFVQLDSSLNRQYAGTGLGLMLVKQIAELHGGTVQLQSELQQGSCFTVHLPHTCLLADQDTCSFSIFDSLTSHPQPTNQQPTKTSLILLAEDNEANISTFSSYLTAKGYHTILAGDGQEAIDITHSQRPDLILMDIQMPNVDGIQAITTIRQNPELVGIPIIALTALAMAGDRERCLAAGANDYLTKPVKLKQLNQKIREWLDLN
jgi:PAS domain S-box-containing protein